MHQNYRLSVLEIFEENHRYKWKLEMAVIRRELDNNNFDENSKKSVLDYWLQFRDSRLGWFTAYLANVFLTKLQDPILPGRSRDHINPKHASGS